MIRLFVLLALAGVCALSFVAGRASAPDRWRAAAREQTAAYQLLFDRWEYVCREALRMATNTQVNSVIVLPPDPIVLARCREAYRQFP